MSRLAIYIDGGYFDQISRQLGVRVDFAKFVDEILSVVTDRTSDTLDLLRTYYYDSLPYQSDPPTSEGYAIMTEWLGIGHLFELSGMEAVLGATRVSTLGRRIRKP